MNYPATFKVETRGDFDIVIERTFNAPRKLVFEAHTRCDLLKRWLFGPDGWELAVCEIDLRVGGKYRYVWRHATKKEMGMGGEFREIAPPGRLVSTERFDEAWYTGEALDIMELTESGGKTKLVLTVRYQSREARDMAAKSGMETGMAAGYDRLDVIFAEHAASAS